MAKKFRKQPNEIIDITIDMETEYFAELDGDYIQDASDVTVTISPTTASPLTDGTTVLVGSPALSFKQWFSGGLDGQEYLVTFLVDTNVGRREEFEIKIKVKDTT